MYSSYEVFKFHFKEYITYCENILDTINYSPQFSRLIIETFREKYPNKYFVDPRLVRIKLLNRKFDKLICMPKELYESLQPQLDLDIIFYYGVTDDCMVFGNEIENLIPTFVDYVRIHNLELLLDN